MIEAQNRNEWRKAIKMMRLQRPKNSKFQKPGNMIGRSIEKKFCATWHMGQITSYDLDVATTQTIWRVKYDDGDMGDYNEKELMAMLIDDNDALELAARRIERPQILLGHRFKHNFGADTFTGTIMDHDEDKATGDIIWGVQFDDGDRSDFNLQEISGGLLLDT
jgi:hypothetical protein